MEVQTVKVTQSHPEVEAVEQREKPRGRAQVILKTPSEK
jgi:hypothetical protein